MSAWAQTPVILISIDTFRADRLSAHTPAINSFADQGTLFEAAQTQIPLTLPAHTTLLTSTWPFETHVEENAGVAPRGLVTLASVLKAHGYKTAAFIGSIFLERQLGLDAGFDTYDSPFDFEAFSRLSGEMLFAGKPGNTYAVRERRAGALVIRAANQWLAAHRGEPVFLFVHLFDMHKPWRQPSYEAQAAAVDQLLGGFQQTLKREGWWDRSLVVLTADHGEGLGDHGESDHGYYIYQSTMHVPLIVHWPKGQAKRPGRMAEPVGLIDVAPSILEFLKIPAPLSFKGRSLLDGSGRPVFGESVYARDCFGWSALRSLREGPWKYIEAPRPELYELSKDPGELHNLVRVNATQAAKLKGELEKYTATRGRPASSAKKDVLESLGYLAPGPRSELKTPAADPKDRLPELLRYEDALTLLQQKRVPAAVAILRGILVSDPRNLLARRDLGVALIEQKKFTEALVELRQVAGASEGDYVTLFELGVANELLGKLPQALAAFEAACRLAPGAVQCKDAVARVRNR
ncbi:MAG: sulfatase-like hydrolase/transferase [Acidobacteriota bacterium]|nr:sulfatase-like hydrolase/transferase [Acidobacteriota bacterium]